MKFEDYNIASEIKEQLAALGFKRPTDIQYKTIPAILEGEDVMAIPQTGTGKTAAFAIPTIDVLSRIKRKSKYSKDKVVQCLVLVPTRELARQIATDYREIGKKTRVKTFG